MCVCASFLSYLVLSLGRPQKPRDAADFRYSARGSHFSSPSENAIAIEFLPKRATSSSSSVLTSLLTWASLANLGQCRHRRRSRIKWYTLLISALLGSARAVWFLNTEVTFGAGAETRLIFMATRVLMTLSYRKPDRDQTIWTIPAAGLGWRLI